MSIRHDEKAANRERKRGREAEGRGGVGEVYTSYVMSYYSFCS
jgi:hypothetical protein